MCVSVGWLLENENSFLAFFKDATKINAGLKWIIFKMKTIFAEDYLRAFLVLMIRKNI